MSERISADEARRLREAATPGPWDVDNTGWNQHRPATAKVKLAVPNGVYLAQSISHPDAALMAAAPALAASVERLEADNQRLRAALDEAARHIEANHTPSEEGGQVTLHPDEIATPSDRINRGVFSSNTEMWSTPQALFDALDAEFGFTLDPCATTANAKCERYYTRDDDGLALSWEGVVFCNPPYNRGIGHWVAKARKEALAGATVVCLIPARTDTAWWHDHAMKADEIRLVRGRLHFGGDHERTAHNAPFPSAVVIFRGTVRVVQEYPRLGVIDRPPASLTASSIPKEVE